MSYNSELLSSGSSDQSSSSQSETLARIKMSEDMKDFEHMSEKIFDKVDKPPIAFKFDFEDYENCKLNGEIKKMISYMKIKLPIFQKEGKQYFIGVGFVNLELRGAIIHVKTTNSIKEETIRFHDFIKQK